VLNVDHPKFYERLERIVTNNSALSAADQSDSITVIKAFRKLPFWLGNGLEMAKLFLMAPIRSEEFQPAVR
jgi:magnesium-protoporphyrin IX monomethyl ester (oxidative) cyclase